MCLLQLKPAAFFKAPVLVSSMKFGTWSNHDDVLGNFFREWKGFRTVNSETLMFAFFPWRNSVECRSGLSIAVLTRRSLLDNWLRFMNNQIKRNWDPDQTLYSDPLGSLKHWSSLAPLVVAFDTVLHFLDVKNYRLLLGAMYTTLIHTSCWSESSNIELGRIRHRQSLMTLPNSWIM